MIMIMAALFHLENRIKREGVDKSWLSIKSKSLNCWKKLLFT